jgi:phage gpG-like protein
LINGALVGDAALIEHIGGIAPKARAELRKAVDLMAIKTLARVKLKLSDDVLRVRTGRLRRSITQAVTDDAGSIHGVVGTNVEYARIHELGFSGSQNIRAHLRTIKTAFGKSIKGGAVTFQVSAHSRQVDIPARSFLASSLAELEPEFNEAVSLALSKAIQP